MEELLAHLLVHLLNLLNPVSHLLDGLLGAFPHNRLDHPRLDSVSVVLPVIVVETREAETGRRTVRTLEDLIDVVHTATFTSEIGNGEEI